MAHALFIWKDKAYDGELAFARQTHMLNTDIAERVLSFEPDPRLIYRIDNGPDHSFSTDVVEVHRKLKQTPSATVAILPIVA